MESGDFSASCSFNEFICFIFHMCIFILLCNDLISSERLGQKKHFDLKISLKKLWNLELDTILNTWHKKSIENINERCEFFNEKFVALKRRYFDHPFIFVDGSKRNERASLAMYDEQLEIFHVQRLHDNCTSGDAELEAILYAITYVNETSRNRKKVVICTDCLNIFKMTGRSGNPIFRNIFNAFETSHVEFVLLFVPSHVGIEGNVKVDAAAKHALNLDYENNTFVVYELI
jgi:ribonuclease HI